MSEQHGAGEAGSRGTRPASQTGASRDPRAGRNPSAPAAKAKAARPSESLLSIPVAEWLDKAAGWIVAGVVAFAPLPFGSVDVSWIATWCLLLAGALLLADPRRMRTGHVLMLIPVGATLAAFLAVIALQTYGTSLVAPNDVWESASEILGTRLSGTVSVNAAESIRSMGNPILVFLAFTAAFVAAADRAKARLITLAALCSGTLYAVIGIYQTFFDPNSLLWMERLSYFNDLTGTFVNRNTAGTYFGCCLILWVVRLTAHAAEEVGTPGLSLEGVRTSPFDYVHRGLAIDVFGAFICLLALVFTHSRAGIIFTFVALFATLIVQMRAYLPARANWGLSIVAIAIVGAFLLEALGGGVAVRISNAGLVDATRLAGYSTTLTIISEQPWLGTGLGTFVDVFPVYRSADMGTTGIWDRAHNTPLELAVELGIPMTAIIVALWLAGLGQLTRAGFGSRRGNVTVLAALGIALLGCLHSLVDFSAQIAGFAAFWAALVGCGLAQSLPPRRAKQAPYKGFDRAAAPTSIRTANG